MLTAAQVEAEPAVVEAAAAVAAGPQLVVGRDATVAVPPAFADVRPPAVLRPAAALVVVVGGPKPRILPRMRILPLWDDR